MPPIRTDRDQHKEMFESFEETNRKRLEQETIRNERASKRKNYGVPIIERMSDVEIESEAKIRKMFSNRNYHPCASCGEAKGTPSFMVSYQLQGIVKLERYCDVCVLEIK